MPDRATPHTNPWHPIETAPKEPAYNITTKTMQEFIDLSTDAGSRYTDCFWYPQVQQWARYNDHGTVTVLQIPFTHWMPPPPPPKLPEQPDPPWLTIAKLRRENQHLRTLFGDAAANAALHKDEAP